MIYQYRCPECTHSFDVVKSVQFIDQVENCPQCRTIAQREFIPQAVFFNQTKVEHPEFNPGLGCVVRNRSHQKEILRQKGLQEVGNEKPETIHKHFDQKREEKLDQAYEEVTRGWVGDGSS